MFELGLVFWLFWLFWLLHFLFFLNFPIISNFIFDMIQVDFS